MANVYAPSSESSKNHFMIRVPTGLMAGRSLSANVFTAPEWTAIAIACTSTVPLYRQYLQSFIFSAGCQQTGTEAELTAACQAWN